MYDKFIDKKGLTTQELLSLGFNKNDLTKMIESGKLIRPKRGYYELANAVGLLYYVKILFSKKSKYNDQERAIKGLKRCAELEPNNGAVYSRLFVTAIINEDWNLAFDCFKVMDNTDNIYYKRDQDLWIYLLSFVTELPEEYRERVRNLKLEDLLTIPSDLRYKDRLLQNKIRNAIMQHDFKKALDYIQNDLPESDRKFNVVITSNLLKAVIKRSIQDHDYLYDLIRNGEYKEVKELLEGSKDLHGLHVSDELFLIVITDLIDILENKRAPKIDERVKANTLSNALYRHDYYKALELQKKYNNCSRKSDSCMAILLERVCNELNNLNISNQNCAFKEKEKIKVDRTPEKLFEKITISLMEQDTETACTLVNKYLTHIDKAQYKNFVVDLIKLGVLNGDRGFSDAMYALTDISKDDFEFFVASYIQDFYFNLARKEFHKAAIYLDILGMSEDLGGAKFSISEMKERLLEDASASGISEEELGFKKKTIVTSEEKAEHLPEENILKIADIMSTVGESPMNEAVGADLVKEENEGVTDKDEEMVVSQVDDDEFVEEPSQVTYTLVDIVDKILDDTNLVMLEPMSEEEIRRVVKTTQRFPKIQTTVLEEETGEKKVVLRYVDKSGPYIDIAATLREANAKFKNWEYQDAIDLFQSVLPKLDSPRSFIYSKLGFAYAKTTYDGDYSKAITYLTMAEYQSSMEENAAPIDYGNEIKKLKKKCGYNGEKISDSDESSNSKIKPMQYKKTN